MNILVVNDDGISKKGLHVLADCLAQLEEADIYVCAPDRERTCASHAVTMRDALYIEPWPTDDFKRVKGAWSCSGTPADCAKFGVWYLKQQGINVDLICSGINHGINEGTDVHYSGTVGAACDGVFMGIPSIAFSLGSHEAAHFGHFEKLVPEVVSKAYGNIPGDCLINVNVPDIPEEEVKGLVVCPLGRMRYDDGFRITMKSNKGIYYEPCSEVDQEGTYGPDNEGTDVSLLKQGWATITPITVCNRRPEYEKMVKGWNIELK